ncbi:Protein-lysine methyltransferase METTL21D [Choanephora cucurbitarum]|uniref:Protein-lysine methyltransferase METTL21D n=1 Tax=Choanephora cucurbitarum TaxID=101091 RepID=A0A1C7NL00_9FUNG|nr:Protein-lysine methyltransferase METTL21D [Choanephora cucurbitarum]
MQDLSDTKALPTFTIQLHPSFVLKLDQLNNTQNHGTTVWDSAKLLAFYLFDSLKRPSFKEGQVQNRKTCLELGSGCGLGGLTMASLGYDTVLTDLPEILEGVLAPNCHKANDAILDWWHYIDSSAVIESPKIAAQTLNWLDLDTTPLSVFDYIIASDCIYEIELVEPLLKCIQHHASKQTVVLIAMERRDDVVVDGFIQKAKHIGFEAKMISKKLFRNQAVNNEDVEIWKLKLKKASPN